MNHVRGASAHDDEMMHTLAMDICFPSQGDEQGITALVVKEMTTQAVGAVMVPIKKRSANTLLRRLLSS